MLKDKSLSQTSTLIPPFLLKRTGSRYLSIIIHNGSLKKFTRIKAEYIFP